MFNHFFFNLLIDDEIEETPLTFIALEDDSSLVLSANNNDILSRMYVQINDESWKHLNDFDGSSISAGTKISFRNKNNTLSYYNSDNTYKFAQFALTGKFNASRKC